MSEAETVYDSTADTKAHQERVRVHIRRIRIELYDRAIVHDDSKLESPEKEIFDVVTPKLQQLTYGSEEYKSALAEMGPALQHHYANNSHHPDHFENGIAGMTLIDLVEMYADWKAASERHGGDFSQSLEINRQRFAVSDQLAGIFENTRIALGW